MVGIDLTTYIDTYTSSEFLLELTEVLHNACGNAYTAPYYLFESFPGSS